MSATQERAPQGFASQGDAVTPAAAFARVGASRGGIQEAVLVGGGPGGTAMLIAASRDGSLPALARRGLTVVERGFSLGGGALHDYAINGDSTAETFLSVVAESAGPQLSALAGHPQAQVIARNLGPEGGIPVPLTDVAAFLDVVGSFLARRIQVSGGTLLTGCQAVETRRREDGIWATLVRSQGGGERTILSRNVVLATGGRQDHGRLHTEIIAGRPLAAWGEGRLLPSSTVLSQGGADIVAASVAAAADPKIVVVGSSTSAMAVCRTLLKTQARLAAGAITLMHRRPLRVFYPTAAAALADGYRDFGPDDICPVSGFVYRLGGFRMEARDLARQLLGIGGRTSDPRLRTHHLVQGDDTAAGALLRDADLVIYALGYRPRALSVLDHGGRKIALAADVGKPMVDGQGRVRNDAGQPIDGLFGLGLAAGFVPGGALGGEPSFSGNANGLWLWQNDLGSMIVRQILEPVSARLVA